MRGETWKEPGAVAIVTVFSYQIHVDLQIPRDLVLEVLDVLLAELDRQGEVPTKDEKGVSR